MRAAGHGIGSHTLSHRVLATLSPEAQAHEIKDSKRSLEAVLGREVFRSPTRWAAHSTSMTTACDWPARRATSRHSRS